MPQRYHIVFPGSLQRKRVAEVYSKSCQRISEVDKNDLKLINYPSPYATILKLWIKPGAVTIQPNISTLFLMYLFWHTSNNTLTNIHAKPGHISNTLQIINK